MSSHADPIASLAETMLELEQIDEQTFRSAHSYDNSRGVIFGGQFLAQSLLAAQQTVPGWAANSMTSYFLRPGMCDEPVDYRVEAVRNGRSFANRRVVAVQSGKVLFDMLCSFHQPSEGFSHQAADIAGMGEPEDAPDLRDYLRANADRLPFEEVESYFQPLPIEFRLIDPDRTFHLAGEPRASRDFWLRFAPAARIEDTARHQPLIAFVSDFWIGPVANDPHTPPFVHRHPVVTVSHSIVFHHHVRADDWMLYRVDTPFAGDGLGLTRGLLLDRQGRLAASTTQEVAMLKV